MTETKDNREKNPELKNKINYKDTRQKLESKETSFTCMNQKILQLCAWILLTVGLCIIVTIFYMAISQSREDNGVATKAEQVLESNAVMRAVTNIEDISSVSDQLNIENGRQNSNLTSRISYGSDNTEGNRNECREDQCKIACANVANISTALRDAIKDTLCASIDILLLEKQEFPEGALKNYWPNFNNSVSEVIIRFSKIVTIKSNAFNSPSFKDTFSLSLYHMNIVNVESGALLGLFRLKYLTIQCHIQHFEPAILQPVQTTLINLILNGHLKINANKNPFGVSHFNNLAYLDLSNNFFNGSLGKNLFKSTPNLKYLIIVESGIQHIEDDAFGNLIEKLLFINLSKNFLTTLAAAVFHPILVSQKNVMINLAKNNWICNCQLEELAKLYTVYHLQFIDVLYCKAPHPLYGVSLDELDITQENCLVSRTTEPDSLEERETGIVTEPEIYSGKITKSTTHEGKDTEDRSSNSNEEDLVENQNMLRMRCFDTQISELKEAIQLTRDDSKNGNANFKFPALSYEFKLELVPGNNSVIVSIAKYSEVFVIWFSEHLETSVTSYGDTSFDYECMRYAAPELIVGPLQENTTYTFCLWSPTRNDISPFNCLPLYVPTKGHENIWISENDKSLTIGILCLIFLLSAVAGALIAYFGFKTYPNLLQCSRNRLIIEKPDQACYVTTISETEYQKQNSLKRKKSSTKQQDCNKLSDTQRSCNVSPIPFCMSGNDLKRLSSSKSSSSTTCFDDSIPVCSCADDEYETPKVSNEEDVVEPRSASNTYCTTPKSPPPLPKRNSNTSNSPALVLNRVSSI